MSRDALQPIARELDRLAASGRSVAVWWRDDDAIRASAALDRLLALSERYDAPVAIAAVPTFVEPSLPERLAPLRDVDVLVHGYSHENHAPAGEKRAEFGAHRPEPDMRAELRRALTLAEAAFGSQALPVFVPPWNRIAPSLAAALPSLGYHGLSAAASRPAAPTIVGCPRLDAHLDPVDWRAGRGLAEPARLAHALRALEGPDETIGFLTHHLAFDDAVWDFTEGFLDLLSRARGVRFASARELFREPPRSSSGRRDRPSYRPDVPALPGFAT